MPLPATLAFDFPTVAALVGHICGAHADTRNPERSVPTAADELSDIRALSAHDAEAMLAEELERARELLS
jgi:hypothetical protein